MNVKRLLKPILSVGAVSALAGMAVMCTSVFDFDRVPREIAFGVLVDEGEGTKAVSEVTTASINSSGFRASATTGSAGSESAVWTNEAFTVNADGFFTASGEGRWWPQGGDPNYHFYASNASLTHTAAGATVSATNSVDVVCAYKETPVYKSVNSLNFEHIFARLSDVSVSAKDGYTITDISIMLTPKTGGTYNLRLGAGQTDGTGWSGVTTAASPVNIAAGDPGVKSNDLWLVPGWYEVTLGWTATKGDYTKTFSGVLQFVQLTRGKINTLTASIGGDAKDVQFAVSVTPWDTSLPAINKTAADFTPL